MSKKGVQYEKIYKVNPRFTVSYWKSDEVRKKQSFKVEKRKKLVSGHISKKSKSNLSNCFHWLRAISNKKDVYSKAENLHFTFRLSFITLTLPSVQLHSDEYIKSHCLAPLLKWLERTWYCNSVIWKAEVQNNGNLHFHITTNKFVHWKSVRSKWNMIMSNHGYCKVFQDGSNDKGDAATQVKAVIKDKDIEKYISSYMSKKDTMKRMWNDKSKKYQFIISDVCELNNHYYLKENYRVIECSDGTMREYKRKVQGRLWGASQHLNQPSFYVTERCNEFKKMDDLMQFSDSVKIISTDFCKIHLYNEKVFNKLPHQLQDEYNFIVNDLREFDVVQKTIFTDNIKS